MLLTAALCRLPVFWCLAVQNSSRIQLIESPNLRFYLQQTYYFDTKVFCSDQNDLEKKGLQR